MVSTGPGRDEADVTVPLRVHYGAGAGRGPLGDRATESTQNPLPGASIGLDDLSIWLVHCPASLDFLGLPKSTRNLKTRHRDSDPQEQRHR